MVYKRTEEEPISTVKNTDIWECDVCGSEVKYRPRKCHVCSRDMCKGCSKNIITWDGCYDSDYPNKICNTCSGIEDRYAKLILDSQEKQYEEECKLYLNWKEESLETGE